MAGKGDSYRPFNQDAWDEGYENIRWSEEDADEEPTVA